ncbi:hypothetical protein SB752_33215, partial [Brevibacillus sp. SIMBA_040]
NRCPSSDLIRTLRGNIDAQSNVGVRLQELGGHANDIAVQVAHESKPFQTGNKRRRICDRLIVADAKSHQAFVI